MTDVGIGSEVDGEHGEQLCY